MNNEIKEIIDKLKDDNWYDELDLTGEMWIELRWKETHLLLDYITNLQERKDIAIRLLIKMFGTDDYEINYILGILSGDRQIHFDLQGEDSK